MPFSGDKIIYQPTCPSTNTFAIQLLATSTPPEGTVVITDHQVAGRGQRGNSWASEPYKNLTFSLILYPTFLAPQANFMLNIMTTLAIHQALSAYIPDGLKIKWPNDLYYQHKKLSGVLIENTIQNNQIAASVIGIGLNVNQTHFDLTRATSLHLINNQAYDLPTLLDQLLKAIQATYKQLKNQVTMVLKEAYLQRLYGLDEKLTFQTHSKTFPGIIRDVDILGRLVIEKESGQRQAFTLQEVSFIFD